MRRVLTGTALAGFAVLLTAPAWAQAAGDGGLPPGFDEDLAAQFEAELVAVVGEVTGRPVDPASLDQLIGDPGDLDLPPGALLATTMASDAVALAGSDALGGGSSLTGPCMGLALSFDGDGELLDVAADLDPDGPPIDLLAWYTGDRTEVVQAFTADNPFRIDVDGFVVYTGIASIDGEGPRNHAWEITTFGQALDSGGDANAEGKNRLAGSVDLGGQLPAATKVNALFRIDGSLTADGGFSCAGGGFVETTCGAPILEGVGAVLLLVGGLGAVFNARPARTWKH